jgi:hypothetical protein
MSHGKKPVFVLGVGAQKAGTSWLHSQVNNCPEADLGIIKEYHVWDAVFTDLAEIITLDEGKTENDIIKLRRNMQVTSGVYENYFRSLIGGGIRLTGDFTPSYATLSAEHFLEIKHRLEKSGFAVKVIFVMRDPVERMWSGFRMRLKKLQAKGLLIPDDELMAQFDIYSAGKQRVARSRYDKTLAAIRTSFHSDDVYIGFYEKLFEQDTLKDISDFLGIDLTHSDVAARINEGNPISLSSEVRVALKGKYSEVYEFCEREYPETKELWA